MIINLQDIVREIVKPEGNTYTLNLPDEMIGKMVEVIAFEINEEAISNKGSIKKSAISLQDIQHRYAQYPMISHDDYQFNRDDASDYE